MPSRQNTWIIEKRKQLIKLFGGMCVLCWTTENLEFAHIKPTKLNGLGRGRKERYYDVKNNPKSYVLMCKKCHERFDHR